MASIIIGHREPRTLDTRDLNTALYLLRYGDLCLRILCSYWKDYLQPNCSAYRNKFKMVSKNIGRREPRTLDPRNVNTTLYRLRYGDLCLTILCSYWKDYLQPNCSACNNKFKMASKNLGHREARNLDLSNYSSTLYRLRYVELCLTIDCSYLEDCLLPNCSAYNIKFKMASKKLAIESLELSILANLTRRSTYCALLTCF